MASSNIEIHMERHSKFKMPPQYSNSLIRDTSRQYHLNLNTLRDKSKEPLKKSTKNDLSIDSTVMNLLGT
jgi:hypothetical protein